MSSVTNFRSLPRAHLQWLLGVACTFGFALLYGSTAGSDWFWIDEILTAEQMGKGVGDLVWDRYNAGHSPLYFLLAKAWIHLIPGTQEATYPDEFLLRLPSIIAIGLAGGFLATCAWRNWGASSGLLFCVLWLLHPLLARYGTEARPYALMMLFLAIGFWANTRLVGRDHCYLRIRAGKPTWIASTAAPILLAATIPIGVIAAILMELSVLLYGYKKNPAGFWSVWKIRIVLVWPCIAAIVAIYAPAVAAKSVDFWTDKLVPISLRNIEIVLGQVLAGTLSPDSLGKAVLLAAPIFSVALVAIGLAKTKVTITSYMSTSLAIGYPIAIIALSFIKSLLVARYFLPSIPGVLLLTVAGFSGIRDRIIAYGMVVCLCISMSLASAQTRGRTTVEAEARFIGSLGSSSVTGMSTHNILKRGLNYYLPGKFGIKSSISDLNLPLDPANVPEGDVLWIFDWPWSTYKIDSADFAGMAIVCEFTVRRARIFAIGRSRNDFPEAIRDCATMAY